MALKLTKEYIFKFYLNANHYILINGKKGETHPHTWEFACDIILNNDQFVQFNQIEKAIDTYFEKYQNQVMNEFEPFDRLNPTLENMAEYFIRDIRDIVLDQGGILVKMESSETPTRSYILSYAEDEDFLSDLEQGETKSLKNIADRIAEDALGE